jgi:hypothetical protein
MSPLYGSDDLPRYSYDGTDYYGLTSTLDNSFSPVYGILDEEAGGYIAFTTDEEAAKRIIEALSAS